MPDSPPTVLTPPARLALQPRDREGRVVPAFVPLVDGKPDHSLVRTDAVRRAHELRLCFLCDLPLGVTAAFLVDSTCVITRVAPEPPSHRTCMEYAVRVCPFLTDPDAAQPGGEDGTMCRRNTGVCAVYITEEWSRHRGRDVFSFRNPFEVTWWTRGRPATYVEVFDSMASGFELLKAEADEDEKPGRAHELLAAQYERALTLLPGRAS